MDDPSVLRSDHWAVTDGEELIGYCCFGAAARVEGAEAEPGVLDVGYALAPDRVGHGRGKPFVGTILEFARNRYDPERLRLFVLDWNERSRRVAASHCFAVESSLGNEDGTFLVMTAPTADAGC